MNGAGCVLNCDELCLILFFGVYKMERIVIVVIF
jgi:hypothetical protein